MKKEVKDFVEKYNKVMEYNESILNSLADFTPEWSKYFVREHLATEKITEEDYDLDRAEVYNYEDGTLELQAYSYNRCGVSYFWTRPDDTNETYKERKIAYIKSEVDKRLQVLAKDIYQLQTEMEEYRKLKDGISRFNKE